MRVVKIYIAIHFIYNTYNTRRQDKSYIRRHLIAVNSLLSCYRIDLPNLIDTLECICVSIKLNRNLVYIYYICFVCLYSTCCWYWHCVWQFFGNVFVKLSSMICNNNVEIIVISEFNLISNVNWINYLVGDNLIPILVLLAN